MEIYSLGTLTRSDAEKVGIKAAFLGELNSEFNVPQGFVISAFVFEQFIEMTRLKPKIVALLQDINPSKFESILAISHKIQQLIISADIPDEIKEEIIEFYHSLDDNTTSKNTSQLVNDVNDSEDLFVAVRSSPTTYFGSRIHVNLHNIYGTDKLLKAVKVCWASLYASKAVDYYFSNGITSASMAVIVQRMLKSQVSGRVSTVSQKSKHEMVIEACLGLGEALTSGLVLPDRYIVDKKHLKITKADVNKQQVKMICDPDIQKTIHMDVSPENSVRQKLNDSQIIEVAKAVKNIEAKFGTPMKIEFSYQNNKLYILKALLLPKELLPSSSADDLLEESDMLEESFEESAKGQEASDISDVKSEESDNVKYDNVNPATEANDSAEPSDLNAEKEGANMAKTAKFNAINANEHKSMAKKEEVPTEVSYPNFQHSLSKEEEELLNNITDMKEDHVVVERETNTHKQEDVNHMLEEVEKNLRKDETSPELKYDDKDHEDMMSMLDAMGKEEMSSKDFRKAQINKELEEDIDEKHDAEREYDADQGDETADVETYEEHEETPVEHRSRQNAINQDVRESIEDVHHGVIEEETEIEQDDESELEEGGSEHEENAAYRTKSTKSTKSKSAQDLLEDISDEDLLDDAPESDSVDPFTDCAIHHAEEKDTKKRNDNDGKAKKEKSENEEDKEDEGFEEINLDEYTSEDSESGKAKYETDDDLEEGFKELEKLSKEHKEE